MGIGVTERGDWAAEATGADWSAGDRFTGDDASGFSSANGISAADESPRDALGLRVTEDRVLIRADREDHAPTQTASGLYAASSLTAAVKGADEADSWFTGTVVQVGPLVQKRDCRATLITWLRGFEEEGVDVHIYEITQLRQQVEAMWTDMPDPVLVGQRVTFSWASGQQITLDGDRFLILRASEVLGVLEE